MALLPLQCKRLVLSTSRTDVLLVWLAAIIRYVTTELAFTSKRIVAKFGFTSRRTIELKIKKAESLQVGQGIIGRIFNDGTVIIFGVGNPQAPIPGISRPVIFRRSFMEYQDRESND